MRLSDLESWLTPSGAAKIIGVSRQMTLRYLQDKHLRGVRTAQGWLVDPDDAKRLARERQERQR